MADNNLGLRLAGAFLGAPLGPLGIAAGYNAAPSVAGFFGGEQKKEPKIGTVLSYLNGRPYEVYAGPWGKQTLGSYESLRAKAPGTFPAVGGTAAPDKKPAPKAPSTPAAPVTTPDWERPPEGAAAAIAEQTEGWGGPQNIGTKDYPAQVQTTGQDPVLERLLTFSEKALTPEFLKQRTDEAIRQFVVTSTVAEALGSDKAEQRRRREVELEKIRQWTDLAKTTTAANVMSQALLGQAMIASQQPSASMAEVLGKGASAAQQVLGPLSLR
jgi:hypothetical protein